MTTLERLKELHDRALTAHHRKNLRIRARAKAEQLGVVVPEWALFRERKSAPAPAPVPEAPLAAPEIPIALRSWRCGGARVVHIRGNGRTTLTRFEPSPEEATFPSARDAERAVLLGSVAWRPARKAG